MYLLKQSHGHQLLCCSTSKASCQKMNLIEIKSFRAYFYKLLFWRSKFECPVCHYKGPFKDKRERKNAKCPACGELERARMHQLVLNELLDTASLKQLAVLHFAPERHFRNLFQSGAKEYISADLNRTDVDWICDMQSIPCENNRFDLVFASHVLEYPEDDFQAMREIHRVLRPGGFAILTIPLVHEKTVDLTERDPMTRMMHEPGLDYFDRMRKVFSKVIEFKSSDFPEKNQVNVQRGRTGIEKGFPLLIREGVHGDIVPVCYK